MAAAPPTAPIRVDDTAGGGRTVRRIAAVAAVTAAVAAFLAWYGNRHDFFDLRIYMSAMRWWNEGNPLYDYRQPDPVQGELYFTYPPFTALLLRPFAALPLGATFAIFSILTLVAVAVTTWWLVGPAADRRDLPRWFAAGLAVPLALAIEPSRETLAFGQINMLLIVLILADLLFAVPRNSRWAGVGIGLATALKLFPGIFIVFLLVTRRWRAALVASVTAAVATLLSAAVTPGDSWRFWTHELWATDRVGRLDYTANQSLLGMLSRFTAPEAANRVLWIVLVLAVTGFGLWRAARAVSAGVDPIAGLTLAGLVGALISPITWSHHLFWLVPAMIVLVDAALPVPGGGGGTRWRPGYLVAAGVVFAASVYGVVSFPLWNNDPVPTGSVGEFLLRNLFVLISLLLLAGLPVRRHGGALGW
ncbi:glycosyltransferase 87 family protein [Polymorphospora rubra]|uniref:glycosyltransferase 87 family protein n=1 Tax=Polymorphospora rubra TaxID=338584 RepID=UPI0033C3EB35